MEVIVRVSARDGGEIGREIACGYGDEEDKTEAEDEERTTGGMLEVATKTGMQTRSIWHGSHYAAQAMQWLQHRKKDSPYMEIAERSCVRTLSRVGWCCRPGARLLAMFRGHRFRFQRPLERVAGSARRLWLQLWHCNLAQMNREHAQRLILWGVRHGRGRRRMMSVV